MAVLIFLFATKNKNKTIVMSVRKISGRKYSLISVANLITAEWTKQFLCINCEGHR